MKKSLFILSNLFLALLFFGCGSRDKDAKKWIPETAEYVVAFDMATLPEIAPFKEEVKEFKRAYKKLFGDEIADCRVIMYGQVTGKSKGQWSAYLIQSKKGQVAELFEKLPKSRAFKKFNKEDNIEKKKSNYGKEMYVIDHYFDDESIDFTITLIDKNTAVVVIGKDKEDIGFLKTKKASPLVEDAKLEGNAIFVALSNKFVKAAKRGKDPMTGETFNKPRAVLLGNRLMKKLPSSIPTDIASRYKKITGTLAVAKENKAVWNVKGAFEGEKTATEITFPLSVYDKDDDEDDEEEVKDDSSSRKQAPSKPSFKDDDDDKDE